jgi:hypothetical protein
MVMPPSCLALERTRVAGVDACTVTKLKLAVKDTACRANALAVVGVGSSAGLPRGRLLG